MSKDTSKYSSVGTRLLSLLLFVLMMFLSCWMIHDSLSTLISRKVLFNFYLVFGTYLVFHWAIHKKMLEEK